MEINIVSGKSNLTISNGDYYFTNGVTVAQEPVDPMDATTKGYVDTQIGNVNSTLTAHVNNSAIHINSTQKSFLDGITVSSTIINYLKGTTGNVQSQLNGLLNKSGGVMSGLLKSSATPSTGLHAITKSYVDNAVGSGSGDSTQIPTGTYILKPSGKTYTGFIQCNGAEISKTTYSNLYSVLGDTYTNLLGATIQPGSGKPWKQQYFINSTQSGDITGWSTETSLPQAVTYSQAIVTKNRVYLLGGVISGSYSSTVYYAPFSGGLNDYSPYYDGTISPGVGITDPVNNFLVPDFSGKIIDPNYAYYVKT